MPKRIVIYTARLVHHFLLEYLEGEVILWKNGHVNVRR